MAQENFVRNIEKLKNRCISFVIEHLVQIERTNSINNLQLPLSIVQQIEGVYQWKHDMSHLLDWTASEYTGTPIVPPFSDEHYRWTNEKGSIKIDRRATAAAQLENIDPAASSPALIKFGFVLASTYCLEEQIRRLWPYFQPLADPFDRRNPAVRYWTAVLERRPDQNPNQYLLAIHSQREGSSDFWLSVLQSYWPIVERIYWDRFKNWIWYVLRYAMAYRHKSVVDFVWGQYTEDMRRSLVSPTRLGLIGFLVSAIRANEKDILVRVLDQFDTTDTRRSTVLRLIDNVCEDFNVDTNLEIFQYLLDCIVADCTRISSEIARPLCKILSVLWDFLIPQKRVQILNTCVDLLRCAFEFGFIELTMRIWTERHLQDMQRFEFLFRDECRAFRTACAKGDLELVKLFWEWASIDQRCRLIGCKSGDALNSAARNGHISILRYLWKNMDSRIAYQSIVSDGISRDTLCQLIISDGLSSHELESFLLMLITSPPDGREPVYPPSAMKGILFAALLLHDGKALRVLVQRAKKDDGIDPAILRSLLGAFNDDQRARLSSKLSTDEDITFCGLESVQIVTSLQAMAVQAVREGEAASDDEDGVEDEEDGSEVIDLTDEYYE